MGKQKNITNCAVWLGINDLNEGNDDLYVWHKGYLYSHVDEIGKSLHERKKCIQLILNDHANGVADAYNVSPMTKQDAIDIMKAKGNKRIN